MVLTNCREFRASIEPKTSSSFENFLAREAVGCFWEFFKEVTLPDIYLSLGTGDFRCLRNVVILATACGAMGIWILGAGRPDMLTGIWWITGIWITIRAGLGLLRIWPAIGQAPLKG